MCSLVFCGSVISRPSSVIILYSISLLVLDLFLACYVISGSLLFYLLYFSFFQLFSAFPLPLLRACGVLFFFLLWGCLSSVMFFFVLRSHFCMLLWNIHVLSFFVHLIDSDIGFFGLSVLIFCIPMDSYSIWVIIFSISSYFFLASWLVWFALCISVLHFFPSTFVIDFPSFCICFSPGVVDFYIYYHGVVVCGGSVFGFNFEGFFFANHYSVCVVSYAFCSQNIVYYWAFFLGCSIPVLSTGLCSPLLWLSLIHFCLSCLVEFSHFLIHFGWYGQSWFWRRSLLLESIRLIFPLVDLVVKCSVYFLHLFDFFIFLGSIENSYTMYTDVPWSAF